MADQKAPALTRLELQEMKIQVSHQEVERILDEIDSMLETASLPNGKEDPGWLPVKSVAVMLCDDLGYEDVDELEDACKCTFEEFVECLPHCETKTDISPHSGEERLLFRLKPQLAAEPPRPFILTCKVESREDLWRVLLKAPQAVIEIPEIEFEIGRSQKRQLDAIYHHIGKSITNIGSHVQLLAHHKQLNEQMENAYTDTLIMLNKLLDVDMPFVIRVVDPSGLSAFKPMDGVQVEYTDEAEQAALAAAAEEAAAEEAAASA